jgi:2-C-methyl-D-erythritol 4-phosphate cytidylyltransferase
MVTAIIVAAGQGTRMGPRVDKLFLKVAGRPLIAHTWRRFHELEEIDEIVLVVREGMQEAFEEIGRKYGLTKVHRLVAGGAQRQDSVWNGLMAVSDGCELVAIHDGARPCTSAPIIRDTLEAARQMGAAVAAQRVTDTIKESDGDRRIARTVDRSILWSVQTPQVFRVEVIRRALAEVRAQHRVVTDDTAACEAIGQAVQLVECQQPNPKATSPADLPYIELLLMRGIS